MTAANKNPHSAWQLVSVASVLHLLVDSLCICCLYLLLPAMPPHLIVAVVAVYNVLAFVTQPLTGMLADRQKALHWLLMFAVVLLTVGALSTLADRLLPSSPVVLFAIASFLGIGNSLFHVWGGRLTAVRTQNDIRAVGTFVSTGAFGLAIGGVFFSWPMLLVQLCALFACSLLVLYIDRLPLTTPSSAPSAGTTTTRNLTPWVVAALVLLLMVFVMLRSLLSQTFSSGFSSTDAFILLAAAVAMSGKLAGGWIAHHLGWLRALILVAIAVAGCFLLKDSGVAVLLVGLFLVNCTMPITLYLANRLLPGREGLAFGLLAAALVPGFLLAIL